MGHQEVSSPSSAPRRIDTEFRPGCVGLLQAGLKNLQRQKLQSLSPVPMLCSRHGEAFFIYLVRNTPSIIYDHYILLS